MNCKLADIEINTVDAFQGREKDIIIFNCVRSNTMNTEQASLGFLTDKRRLNVAITRPRHFLFVVGNEKTLVKDKVWKDMVTQAHSKQRQGGYFMLTESSSFYNEDILEKCIMKDSDQRARMEELKNAVPKT